MKTAQEQYQSNGSTLLLAMVIVSTILLVGMSISLILSRQTREGVIMRGEAIGFYVADSVIEKVALDGESFDFEREYDFDFASGSVKYEVEHLSGKKHLVTVKIGNNYYEFVRQLIKTGSLGLIYFKNDQSWDDVVMHYALYDLKTNYSGKQIYLGKENMTPSSSSAYPEYMENEIDLMGKAVTIRAYFCRGKKDDVVTCWDGEQPTTKAHDIIGIEEHGTIVCEDERETNGICGKKPFISYVNE